MGWIEHYLELVEETEPPREFNFWSAIAGIGHVLGRKVWLDQYLFKVYPAQTMVLLCADSAVSRKTTAMRNVGALIQTLPRECQNIIAERVTGATLLDELNRADDDGNKLDAVGMIFVGELGEFFSKDTARTELPTLVTTLNDGKEGVWRAPTRHYGALELLNPCIGMVAGVTRTGLAQEVPSMVRKTGFLGRCVVVDSDGPTNPCPLVEPPKQFNSLRAWLLKDLHFRLAALKGEFTWSDDAKEWYVPWYNDQFFRARDGHDSTSSGWMGRKHVHLLRTAMIFTCCARNELVLRVDMLEKSLTELDKAEKRMPNALQEVGESGDDHARKEKLIAKCRQMGNGKGTWVPKRKLFAYVWRSYGKGHSDLFERDLKDVEMAGLMTRRLNEKGRCEEWQVTAAKAHQLDEVTGDGHVSASTADDEAVDDGG